MAATNHKGDYAPVRDAGDLHRTIESGYLRADLMVLCQDHVQLASGVEVGSKIYMGDLDWDCILDPDLSKIHFDDAGTSVTLDIGDSNDVDALAADIDIATAAGSASIMASVDRANYGKRLWQLLGYASRAAALATGAKARVYGTVAGANLSAATDLFWRFVGTSGA